MTDNVAGRGMRSNSPQEFLYGFSRKIGRHVHFRPYSLKLDEAVVAFTFDDFPVSCYQNAAPALEDAGMRGTFYLASGLMGRYENGQLIVDEAMVRDLSDKGHEIGGHTHDHVNVQRTPLGDLKEDVRRNDRIISKIVGHSKPVSFAYPFGMISVMSKLTLMQRYPALRGIKVGTNHGIIDLAHLKAQELYDCSNDSSSIDAMLDDAQRRKGWLIFYTHDVRPDPTNIGCTPRFFSEVVEKVRKRGMKVETVIDTVNRLGIA
jgi:peptidoglycan/xylan/chitin deacetylase (PgdA/CDA1 family)